MAIEDITMPFLFNGDYVQPAYRLLGPAVADGLRVLRAFSFLLIQPPTAIDLDQCTTA
jgi:hypothetical protein